MLVDPKWQPLTQEQAVIEEALGRSAPPVRLRKGVWLTELNASLRLPHGQQRGFDKMFPRFDTSPSYGVCDSWEQALERFPEFESDPRPFVLTLAEICKEDQPEKGGWRWHKWGEYIGTHFPRCEYLYDETGIERVFCFSLIELLPDEIEAADAFEPSRPNMYELDS